MKQFRFEQNLSVLFAAGTVVVLLMYLGVHERVPNYLRVLAWFNEWLQVWRGGS